MYIIFAAGNVGAGNMFIYILRFAVECRRRGVNEKRN